ncbi:MAG TPA: ATP-binding protein [Opitutaceae bacterium]|nr:ATP-binding protein [Opitutaceae bacterium]
MLRILLLERCLVGLRGSIACVLLVAAVVAGAEEPASRSTSAPGASEVHVLVLNSYHPGYNWSDGEQAAVLRALGDARPDVRPSVEYMDWRRFPYPAREALLFAHLDEKYKRQPFNLIIALDDPAVTFVLAHRDYFGATVPVVFGGVNDLDPELLGTRRCVTGVAQTYDFSGTLELIHRLQPDVRRIAAVHCRTESGLATRHAFERVLARERPPFAIEWVEGWTAESLLQQVERMPDGTAVLLLSIFRDEAGRVLVDDPEFGRSLALRSRVPVYFVAPPLVRFSSGETWETAVWQGMGGSLLSEERHGELVGQLAVRVLAGEPVESIPVVSHSPARVAFDFVQLQRHGIPRERLPPNAEVFHLPKTFYQVHRSSIVAGLIVIGVLAATVLVLCWIIVLRRRAERALRRSHEHFELIARATNDAVWDQDLVAGTLWWNDGYAAQLQLPPGTVMTINQWENHVHPSDRAWFLGSLRSTIASEVSRRMLEYRVVRADGDIRHVLDRICIARNPDGGAVRVIGARIDLTDRLRAELERKRLAAAVEQSAVATALFAPDGAVQFVNPAFVRATGLAAPQNICDLCSRCRHDDAVGATLTLENVLAVVAREGRWSSRLSVVRADGGTCLMLLAVYPIRESADLVGSYVLVGQDVTRETKLEEQVRLSQKMEAVGLLAGGIAHDFNNLLQVIDGFTEQAQDAAMAEDRAECLVQVREACARAVQLTRQLLVFSREDRMAKAVDIDLNQLIARQTKMLRRLLESRIELVLTPAATPATVVGDPGQLEQVFMNLCINARDAMPRGGRITIELGETRLDADYCAVHPWARPGHFVQVAVTDTGNGMDRATLARIFEPFFTTKTKDKGTGLGLAVVYGIVQHHDGLIHVYSEPGVGTTFRIFLPLQTRGATGVVAEAQKTPQRGSGTILLAEDDPSVRALAERVLSKAGYAVLAAGDGAEALEVFKRERAVIALVVLDAVLPTLSGREVYEEIRRLDAQIPVVFCSGYSAGTIQPEYFPGEGVTLLGKPYAPNALLESIGVLLAKSVR